MKLAKIVVKLFLVWATVFCMANWIQADELSAIKNGYNSYWSNIKDGKGSNMICDKFFAPSNPDKPSLEMVKHFNWMFMGSKVRYDMDMYHVEDGKPTRYFGKRDRSKTYFDGEKILTVNDLVIDPSASQSEEKYIVKIDGVEKEMSISKDGGKSLHLREVQSEDVQQTNYWDPRLIATGTARLGNSWQPFPSWEERNWKVVGTETLNGHECYVIESVLETPSKTQIIDRKWISPDYNFCLVQREARLRVTEDSVLSKEMEWQRSLKDVLIARGTIEYQKYGNDFWGPAKYTTKGYAPDPEKKSFYLHQETTITYDKNCIYNAGLSSKDLKIIFPSGATIYDDFTGIGYPANPTEGIK